jgi:hypothetical protein
MNLGISLSLGSLRGAGGGIPYTPDVIFADGSKGFWYDIQDLSTLWANVNRTIPAVVGGPVRGITDKSGNGYHYSTNTLSTSPTLQQDGAFYYLDVDGLNDQALAYSLDFSARREMSVFAAIMARVNSPTGTLINFGALSNGSWEISAPDAGGNYRSISRGTTANSAVGGAVSAPEIAALTALMSIGPVPTNILRKNKTQIASNSAGQGTGDYQSNGNLTIGGSSGTYFNGRIYQLIGVNKLLDGQILTDTEDYVLSALPAPPPPVPAGILDSITAPAAAAYSVARRLRTAYTGPAIRVRRSSDNAEVDIGFTPDGDLDSAALSAFVGLENLLLRSEEFDNTFWTKNRASIAANDTLAPDGTMTADRLVEDTSASLSHRFYSLTTAVTANSTHTFSVYAKANTRSWIYLRISEQTGAGVGAYFDLTNGTIGAQQSGITAIISDEGNGWYRCAITHATPQALITPYVGLANANNGEIYTGDGTSSLFVWGAQLNTGTTAKTYVATTAGISGDGFVTTWYDQSGNGRSAPQAAAANQPRIVNGGVVELKAGLPAIRLLNSRLNITPISSANRYVGAVASVLTHADNGPVVLHSGPPNAAGFMGWGSTGGMVRFRIRLPDPGASFQYTNPINTNAVMAYVATGFADIKYYLNGTLRATDTAATSLRDVTGIGGDHAFQRVDDGTVQEVVVFASALTTADRQTLEQNQGEFYGITVA